MIYRHCKNPLASLFDPHSESELLDIAGIALASAFHGFLHGSKVSTDIHLDNSPIEIPGPNT